jgi:peptide/nickel transport system ATP-binding protein
VTVGPASGVEVAGLRVDHAATGKPIVDDVSFSVEPGASLALVGESGSGKTTVAMALLGHARPGAQVSAGTVVIGGADILSLSDAARRRLRGTKTTYVGQDPANSLDPSMRIGKQMREMLATHGWQGERADQRIAEYLTRVALPEDRAFLRRYPHELSGGQIQRVLLAMALAVDPTLVVLDEPTTSLDVKVQRDVLTIIRDLKSSAHAALVYVSHDLAVVSEIADHVAVMYGGRIVEQAPAGQLFADPRHPYTTRLLGSVPRITPERQRLQQIAGAAVGVLDRPAGCPFQPRCLVAESVCAEMPPLSVVGSGHTVRCYNAGADAPIAIVEPTEPDAPRVGDSERALLAVRGLSAEYASQQVVHDVDLRIDHNECLGIVGESGSGKTTLARCVVGLHSRWTGDILLEGAPIARSARDRARTEQRDIQIVFQNPTASLNPKKTVFGNLQHVIQRLRGIDGRRAQRAEAAELLELVRMPTRALDSYPRQLSGGEKQRVAIARALAARPRLLLCDEVTSALDVSVQAAIVGLIEDLQREIAGLAVMFISHDLAVVRAVADRIIVMQSGRIVEEGGPQQILFAPTADYTRLLIESIPTMPDPSIRMAVATPNRGDHHE